MFCRPKFFLFAAVALLARAQTETVITGATSSVTERGEVRLTKGRLTDGQLLLVADEFTTPEDRSTIVATGNVVLTYGAVRLLADKLVYHRADGTFNADHVRLGSFPYFAESQSASGTPKEITLLNATATYGEPGPWQPTMRAAKIIFAPGQRLRTENSQVGIGHAQPIPLPHLTQNLHESLITYATLTGGFRHSLGAFAEAGLHLPTSGDLRLGGDIGVYTSRGIMVGPSGNYAVGPDGDDMRGWFRTGYINDHGDKRTDLLGRPVPENRAYAEWSHTQQLTPDVTLNAQLEWWKDSEVLRDFRPRVFFPVQQPDTFLESTYAAKNYFVSLFARFQPNSFERVQQRLPELRFDLLPTAIGGGFYERFSASAAVLRENQVADGTASRLAPIFLVTTLDTIPVFLPSATALATSGPDRRSTRLDAYYAISRPMAPTEWFTFTPMAGARVTHYANPRESVLESRVLPFDPRVPFQHVEYFSTLAPLGDYTRTLGELGFDAALRTSGTFDYKNAQWKIDGLRHLFTPRLGYRYIPEAGKGRAHIPPIDRQTFATYLQPLGLGDQRNVDDLHATNTLRLGFDNTLQTRDPVYGSRDLLVFNVANDFRFKHTSAERPTSEIHTELGVMPARWLEASVYQSLTSNNLTLREFNSAVTIHDADAWSVRFASNFLRHQLEDYLVDGRYRLNERFEALARLNYDVRKRRFNEQAYGLVQNLDNTWRISYVVSLYEGRARESRFGFSVQIDTVRF